MGNITIDKGLLAMILGPLVGLLVMKGYIDPRNADSVVQAISTIIGGTITIITLGYGIYHDLEFRKLKAQKTETIIPEAISPVTPSPVVDPTPSV